MNKRRRFPTHSFCWRWLGVSLGAVVALWAAESIASPAPETTPISVTESAPIPPVKGLVEEIQPVPEQRFLHWTRGGYPFSILISSHVLVTHSTTLSGGEIQDSGFFLPFARVGLSGQAGSEKLSYFSVFELAKDGNPVLDYFLNYEVGRALTLRAGQDRVGFSRSFLVRLPARAFLDLNQVQNAFRYDRDIGVWATGDAGNTFSYQLGITNGAGRNLKNDNRIPALSARLTVAAFGKQANYKEGDAAASSAPSLTLGMAGVFNPVAVPETVGGATVDTRDVDGDARPDNVGVWSGTVDAVFRFRGLEAQLEGYIRHEAWGDLLDEGRNPEVENLIEARGNLRRNYLGMSGQTTYFVVPGRVMVGARGSVGSVPVLRVGNIGPISAPSFPRVAQGDILLQGYEAGFRKLGLMYSITRPFGESASTPRVSHRLMLQVQLLL